MTGRTPSELGRRAEAFAARYVASLGWRVLGRNVFNRYGEVDIVALEGEGTEEAELVMVEVRFRTIGEIQSPVDSVGPKKLRSLVNSGRALVERMGWTGFWRIDLIGVTGSRGSDEPEWRLEHIRDITGSMLPPSMDS